MFKMISDIFANHPWVIKTVPVEQRAKYIYEMLSVPGSIYLTSDYTSFEAHFVEWLMEIERSFYLYMMQYSPDILVFHEYLRWLGGESFNVCRMRGFGVLYLAATRMSGEMNTSLGNTFHNMMVLRFMGWLNDCVVKGLTEGDDGISTFYPPERTPTEAQFGRFGWTVKLIPFHHIGDASFCGNVFSEDNFVVVTDPIKVLLNLGWAGKKYLGAKTPFLNGILKCKAMSAACQYRGVPIIWAASCRILELLEGVTIPSSFIDAMDSYHKEQTRRWLNTKIVHEVPQPETRSLVERLYGYSIESQLELETELLNMPCIQPITIPDHLIRQEWRDATKFFCDEIKPIVYEDREGRDRCWQSIFEAAENSERTLKSVLKFHASYEASWL